MAVVEVSLPPFTAAETVEIPATYFGGREGYVYVHNGRRWSRSRKLERASALGRDQGTGVAQGPGLSSTGLPTTPPHTPPRPPMPSITSFPGNFLHDAATMRTNADVAVKWNMTQQRVIDLVAQLRAQGFKVENYA